MRIVLDDPDGPLGGGLRICARFYPRDSSRVILTTWARQRNKLGSRTAIGRQRESYTGGRVLNPRRGGRREHQRFRDRSDAAAPLDGMIGTWRGTAQSGPARRGSRTPPSNTQAVPGPSQAPAGAAARPSDPSEV